MRMGDEAPLLGLDSPMAFRILGMGVLWTLLFVERSFLLLSRFLCRGERMRRAPSGERLRGRRFRVLSPRAHAVLEHRATLPSSSR